MRVLVADDQEIVRTGLRTILDSHPDLEVVAEASNGREAVSLRGHTARMSVCSTSACPCWTVSRRPVCSPARA